MATEKDGQLDYLNGLKGIGAGIVYLCHFVFAFYYSAYSLEGDSHLPGEMELFIGKTPLNLLFNGNFAVRLFLVISGYVLCLGIFRRQKEFKGIEGVKYTLGHMLKRYFRLVFPILITNVLIFALMCANHYQNDDAALLTGSLEWFGGFNQFKPSLWSAIKEAVFGCFIFGSNDYNGVLWTIPYLFLGALPIYVAACFCSRVKYRYVLYILVGILLIKTDFAGLFYGYVLCDYMNSKPVLLEKWKSQKWYQVVLWIVLIVSLYLSSYPSGGSGLDETIYGVLGTPMVILYHLAGAVLLVFAVVSLKPLQKFFAWKIFVYMGKISYCMYLVHFMVIATLGSQFLLAFWELLPYNVLVFLDFIIVTTGTIVLAQLAHRWIEPWGKIGERFVRIFG